MAKEKIVPKELLDKEFKVKEPELPKGETASIHFYKKNNKPVFARVNLPAKLVRNMELKEGDRLQFEIRKQKANNGDKTYFCAWVV